MLHQCPAEPHQKNIQTQSFTGFTWAWICHLIYKVMLKIPLHLKLNITIYDLGLK